MSGKHQEEDDTCNIECNYVRHANETIRSNPSNSDESPMAYNSFEMEQSTPRVAMIVHLSLAFFATLFALAVVGSIWLVSRYGVVIFMAIVLLLFMIAGIVYLVGFFILEEDQLKRARFTVNQWQEIAKAAILEELNLMKVDLHEHFLLTNEPANDDAYLDNTNSSSSNEKRKRSKILRVILAPFGGLRKRKKNKKKNMTEPAKGEKKTKITADTSNTKDLPDLV
eukprot:CAMPEP_0116055856 /NCGR_PEP_ID=MMETSP0322-20121206/3662_1 /TAXON_ID=163516 /ORGANISM="Leptocylindrus danicus var. apora, Strain B651" /LENGTH=224 /DNA_ID=CAMNT_0003539551 /DNA_START=122 /DNA_END=796 /DNA_ORIENTATION=+